MRQCLVSSHSIHPTMDFKKCEQAFLYIMDTHCTPARGSPCTHISIFAGKPSKLFPGNPSKS